MKVSTIESFDKIKFARALPTIYVTGGKKGSMFINQLVLNNLSSILEQANLIWSCGSRKGVADYNEIKQSITNLSQKSADSVYLKKYFLEGEIGKVYKTADLVVSRAGAHTIYELAVMRKSAIVIPLPITTHNEQVKNAKLLERMGIARIIYEDNFTNDEFINIVQNMLRDLSQSQNNETKDDTIDIELKGQENLGNEIIKILKN
jgi:UDP-N-acetylglucosamine--N-acetylmuramyl-(pentapeptide) pyrophosphoryl-undecaprenol N-acetylglucosamine transferase